MTRPEILPSVNYEPGKVRQRLHDNIDSRDGGLDGSDVRFVEGDLALLNVGRDSCEV